MAPALQAVARHQEFPLAVEHHRRSVGLPGIAVSARSSAVTGGKSAARPGAAAKRARIEKADEAKKASTSAFARD